MNLEQKLQQCSYQLGEQLKAKGLWITCAESCTGGLVAKSITDIAGSSAYFDRGFITYSNQAKRDILQVQAKTLQQYGAVSQKTAEEMAIGALIAAKADLALAVTGIAGPDGGTLQKPVGTVWFAWAYKNGGIESVVCHFSGERLAIRLQAAFYALEYLVKKSLDTV